MELISQRPFISHGPISGPFHTGAYIQRGGNVFKWLGHVARSVLFPAIKNVAKTISPVTSLVEDTNLVDNLKKHAKKAAVSGAIDASTRILKGENVKQSLISSGKKAGSKLKRSINKEANKIGQKIVEKTGGPPAKKKKRQSLKATSKPYYAKSKTKGRSLV